jgi:leucine dehydrogenase
VIPEEVRALLRDLAPERAERLFLPEIGLTAYVVLDSTVLGPAAGGVRTTSYASERDAALDACRLARSMTYKCALGGLDAGGGKIVLMETDSLDRERAFEALGRAVHALDGDLRTAGDLGTTDDDLRAMARHTRWVHTDTANLAGAVARGVLGCAEACAEMKGRPGLSGMRAAVQGCGDIGAAVAEAFTYAGASVRVADIDEARARALAERIGASVVSPKSVLYEDVDLIAPCAVGGVVTESTVQGIRAWAVCGGANHICADERAHLALLRKNILFVPDLISSAGAVIEGIGRTVMGMEDRTTLIDALRHTALLVLGDSARSGLPPIQHALARARQRLADAAN